MELYLVPSVPLTFKAGLRQSRYSLLSAKSTATVDIRPVNYEDEYRTRHVNCLKNLISNQNLYETPSQKIWKLSVEMTDYPLKFRTANVRIWVTNGNSVDNTCFKTLENILGGLDKFRVNVKMSFKYHGARTRIHITDAVICNNSDGNICNEAYYEMNESFSYDRRLHKLITTAERYKAHFSMTLKLGEDAMDYLRVRYTKGPLGINRQILKDSISSDAVIVTKTGVEIKVHKAFLAVRSVVFRAMFESGMQEAITSRILMPDMTESGARALLAYIYCWELVAASKSCDISLELLQAAEMYGIIDLEKDISELIMSKSSVWFSVINAVQLIKFALRKWDNEKNVNYQTLMATALNVLDLKSPGELRECEEFIGFLEFFLKDDNALLLPPTLRSPILIWRDIINWN